MILEVGKCFYELPRVLVGSYVIRVPDAQVANETSEKSFDCAHGQKRKMNDIMHDAMHYANGEVLHKCAEINMRKNEGGASYIFIDARAFAGEYARAAFRLIRGKREETGKERERNEIEDDVCHGN